MSTECANQLSKNSTGLYSPHEEGFSSQKAFKQQVLALVQVIKEMGNPFLESSPELLALDSRDVVDQSVVDSVRSIETIGKDQFNK